MAEARPDEIASGLIRLRRIGGELRRRPADEVLDALGRVLDSWREPGSPWRRRLESELPAATGFGRETLRAGLELGLAPYTGEALRRAAREQLGTRDGDLATGSDVTAVLLAGSIPLPSLLGLLTPLALRSPVLAKPPSRDPVTAACVAESLRGTDPMLGDCLEVVAFPGEDADAMAAFLDADCVVATGSDATVSDVAERIVPPRRLLRHGHRLSIGVLGPEACAGALLERAAAGLALDASLWDQLGCLSAIAVYVVGDRPATERVADALANAFADLETRLPRGRVEPAAAAELEHERAVAEVRVAADPRVRLHRGEAWTVVCEVDAAPRPAPLHRFLRVHPVADPLDLADALAPIARHLASVALAGFGSDEAEVSRRLVALGASRVCAPGTLQGPPLDWPRDGHAVLASLARPELLAGPSTH